MQQYRSHGMKIESRKSKAILGYFSEQRAVCGVRYLIRALGDKV